MQPRLQTYLAAAFAFLALVLAVAGVYGVMSNAVARRAPEIAVRMALGCASGAVVALVMRRGTRIVAAGVALGAGGAWTLSQVMSSLLFEVDPTDFRTLATTSVAVALAAAAACYFPARRASRIDPVTALRGV
jgi:ABC-type antimicrobial peptide transport system permease subunit